jgi:glycerophosphoryl diester phosphodiesterase
VGLAAGTRVVAEAKSVPGETAGPAQFVEALAPYLTAISLVSFDERVLAAARRRQAALATTFLFEEPLRIATSAAAIGPRSDLVTPDLIEAAHALGVRVVPWTVNDPLEMSTLLDLGVDGLVTDEPALV